MRLRITTRLTITSAVLTALVFVPASVVLYVSVASRIRNDSARIAEAAAQTLAFMALYEWDEEIMVEYETGVPPLQTIAPDALNWALVRGDGAVIQSRGIFERADLRNRPGESFMATVDDKAYRIGSAPLFAQPRRTMEGLPEPTRANVTRESPQGVFLDFKREFLRYKSDPTKGKPGVEVAMFEPDRIVELLMTNDGTFTKRDDKALPAALPPDLVDMVAEDLGVEDPVIVSWNAYSSQLIAVLRGRSPSGEEVEVAVNRLGERFLLDADGEVLRRDPESRLWMVTTSDASNEIAAIRRLPIAIASGALLLWAAVVAVGWYVTRRALSPVKRIVETVETIEVSRLAERLPVGEVRDELGSIAATINKMLDRVEDGYRRERRFTGDASHELRGPLAKVIADIDVALAQERTADEYREVLIRCRDYSRAMQRLIESLLWLARLDSRRATVKTREFELTDLVADIVRLFQAEEAGRVRLVLGEGELAVNAMGDPDLIRVMLQNLVQNALRYSPSGEPVEIRIKSDNGTAMVNVQDRGEGVPDEEIEHVFSRFYRVDKSRSRKTGGFGLGLAIVHEIARAHGSRVSLQNVPQGGLVASFSLPLAKKATRSDCGPE